MYPEVDFLSSHPGRVVADDRADPRLRSSRCLRTLYSRWANSRDAFACLAYWRHPRGRASRKTASQRSRVTSTRLCWSPAQTRVAPRIRCARAMRALLSVRVRCCVCRSRLSAPPAPPPTLSGPLSADRPETTCASSLRGASAPFTAGGRTAGTPSPASRIGATPVEGPRGRLRLSAVV